MKWMIASDIHGSAKWCRELLNAYDREGADRLLLLGDVLYHGPRNDLPDEYAPKEVLAMLNARKDEILCVRGNCEAERKDSADCCIVSIAAEFYAGFKIQAFLPSDEGGQKRGYNANKNPDGYQE